MKDEITKKIIKQRKRELKKLTFSLGNVKWTLIALVIMIGCFIISYICKNTWISNVLISVGAGFITGLVFYWLSNLRNNKILQLENEIALLEPVYNDLTNIANLHLFVKVRSMEKYNHKNQGEIADEIMESIERLAVSIHKLNNTLSETIDLRNEDPFNYDSYQEFRKNYEQMVTIDECRQWSNSVCEKLRNITDKVSILLKEKKDTLEILQKNIF